MADSFKPDHGTQDTVSTYPGIYIYIADLPLADHLAITCTWHRPKSGVSSVLGARGGGGGGGGRGGGEGEGGGEGKRGGGVKTDMSISFASLFHCCCDTH